MLFSSDNCQHIEPAQLFVGLLNKFLAESFISHVSRNRIRFTPGGFDQLHDFFGVVFLAGKVVDDYISAFTSKGDRSGSADSGIPAGDKRLTVSQTAASPVRFFAVISSGLHLAVGTRRTLGLMPEFGQRILLRWVLQSV